MHDLNPEQQAAVDAGSGVYQVLAGPGSGKTKTLVARYQRLISHPAFFKVLCLTFTRAAASEMCGRAGGGNFRTIGSQAFSMVRGYVATYGESSKFVSEALKLPSAFWPRFDYVMVDESQDCSSEDWEFIRRLSPNLFCVGDFQQALFSWRGAAAESFLEMPKMFPNCQTLSLSTNYRSTKKIVEFCRSIAPLRGELLSRMCTDNEEGEPVEFLSFENNVAEAEGVLKIASKLEGRTAILARTNRQLDVFRRLEVVPCLYDLMTVHRAKGGEWSNVFLVGAQEGLLPIKNGDLDEEARILFVAASRAKKRLFVSNYGTRSSLL